MNPLDAFVAGSRIVAGDDRDVDAVRKAPVYLPRAYRSTAPDPRIRRIIVDEMKNLEPCQYAASSLCDGSAIRWSSTKNRLAFRSRRLSPIWSVETSTNV